MQRREFLGVRRGVKTGWPLAAHAQQTVRMRRIGVLVGFSAIDQQGQSLVKSFRVGLQERGWMEGRNIEILPRYAEEKLNRLADLAIELVRANVEVIVTHGTPPVQAAQKASGTLPIVFATIGDPVGAKIVASLARPGGNVTGLSLIATELGTKRLELLREIVPGLVRVAMLWNPTNDSLVLQFRETETAARILNLQLQSLPVTTASEFSNAVKAAREARAGALITTSDSVQVGQRAEIAKLAVESRLPLMGEFREIAEAGAILTYGPSRTDMWRRAAGYVDKILKGAKPTELPVEQPTRFELILNLKTAKALDLAVPPTLIARADEVIE